MRIRALWVCGVALTTVGALMLWRSIDLGVWTTAAASLGLVVAGSLVTYRRTAGVVAATAVGAAFAASALLGMTNVPTVFLAIAALAVTPACVAAGPMLRFDRAVAIFAITTAIVVGGASTAALRVAGPPLLTALANLEADLDLAEGRWVARWCGPRQSSYAIQERRLEAAGIETEYVTCEGWGPRNYWNAAYNERMFEGERAWAHDMALGTAISASDL